MSPSDYIPIHGGHPLCECEDDTCKDLLLITWSMYRHLEVIHGHAVRIVNRGHEGSYKVVTTNPNYSIVEEGE